MNIDTVCKILGVDNIRVPSTLEENQQLKIRPVIHVQSDGSEKDGVEVVISELRDDGRYEHGITMLGEIDISRIEGLVPYLQRMMCYAERV
jgi:hypothetical protein